MKSKVPLFLCMMMLLVMCGAMVFMSGRKSSPAINNIAQNTEQKAENNTDTHENLFTGEDNKKVSSNTVTGTITSVEDTYVIYEYTVDGQTYNGKFKVDIKGFSASAVYSVGNHITVEYVPGRPSVVKSII